MPPNNKNYLRCLWFEGGPLVLEGKDYCTYNYIDSYSKNQPSQRVYWDHTDPCRWLLPRCETTGRCGATQPTRHRPPSEDIREHRRTSAPSPSWGPVCDSMRQPQPSSQKAAEAAEAAEHKQPSAEQPSICDLLYLGLNDLHRMPQLFNPQTLSQS